MDLNQLVVPVSRWTVLYSYNYLKLFFQCLQNGCLFLFGMSKVYVCVLSTRSMHKFMVCWLVVLVSECLSGGFRSEGVGGGGMELVLDGRSTALWGFSLSTPKQFSVFI